MDDQTFVDAVEAFLASDLTADLREASRRTLGTHSAIEASRLWHARLYARGWIAPAWPAAWGGTGWTPRQRFLFDRACALADAPVMFAGGLRSLGPLLIEAGTDAQRARFLQPILSGAHLWCQGFSEPGAGSDLAAVRTRARRDGDDYLVDGTKIWTTGAHLADWMFALVRTADEGRPRDGLTFLLIDMASEGVRVAPILDLAGQHDFNQVFLDGVRVPLANRVGEENAGWAMARRLMQLARSNNTPAALVRRVLRRAERAIRADGAERALWTRLAELEIALAGFEQLELSALAQGRPDAASASTPSMLKLMGSDLHQRAAELAMQALGPRAAAALAVESLGDADLFDAAHGMAKHLCVRAATIYSGASEVQRDVIARALLQA